MRTVSGCLRVVCWSSTLLLLASVVRAGEGDRADGNALRGYYAGNGLLQRGLYDAAIEEYRSFLKDHPDDEKVPTARYGLSVALFRLNRFADAAVELARLRDGPEFEFAAETSYMLGQCRLESGQREEALAQFRDVLARHGRHKLAPDAAVRISETLYQLGRLEECHSACEEFLSKWPDAPQRERWLLLDGTSESARGNWKPAGACFEKQLADFPAGPSATQALLGLGQCRRMAGKPDEAVKLFRQVLDAKNDAFKADALLGLSEALVQQGNWKGAAASLDELLQGASQGTVVAGALLLRGRVWMEQSALDRAAESFTKAAELSPELKNETAYWLAKCEFREGKFKEAARRLRKALQSDPANRLRVEMAYDRIVALLKAGEREKAVEELEGFIGANAKHPLAPDAMELLATTLHEAGKYEASDRVCGDYLEHYPDNPRAASVAFVRAENEFLRQRYTEAAGEFHRFVERYGKDDRVELARCREGLALAYAGKPAEAIPLLEKAAAAAGSDARLRPALLALGGICLDRSEWKRCEEILQQFVRLAAGGPSEDEALLKIGLAQARQNRMADALRTLEDLIKRFEKSPHRTQAIFERGQVLMTLKRDEEARRAFEELLTVAGDSRFAPFARKHLGTLAMQRGDFERAEQLLGDAAMSRGSDELAAEALFQRALALMAGSRFAQSEKAFRDYLALGENLPQVEVARAQLAIVMARQERYEEALRAARQVAIDKLGPEAKSALRYEEAWCLRQLSRPDEAGAMYRQLVDDGAAGDLRFHAMLELAALESASKHQAQAVDLLQKLRACLKDRKAATVDDLAEQACYRLGLAQFELEKFADAAVTLAEFEASFPKSASASSAAFYQAESLFRINKLDGASRQFARALQSPGEKQAWHAAAMLRWGDCLARLEQWSRSEEVYAGFLRDHAADETAFQATFGIGWARENQGRQDEAIESYRAVVAGHRGPTAARAQFQIGECLFARKKYEEAVRELLKVEILYDYPEWSAAAVYEAGRCLEKLSKTGEARRQFETVVQKYKSTNWAALASRRLAELSTVAMPGHPQG